MSSDVRILLHIQLNKSQERTENEKVKDIIGQE